MNIAQLIDAIPIVQSTADRGTRFATPTTDQRVFNKGTGNIERWNGASWVTDFTGEVSTQDIVPAGTAALPGLAFIGDTTSGLYDAAVGTVAVSVSAVGRAQWTVAAYSPVVASGLTLGTAALPWGSAWLGQLTLTTAVSKIIPGATSLSHRNNADSADNLLIMDGGSVQVRSNLRTGAAPVAQQGIAMTSTLVAAGGYCQAFAVDGTLTASANNDALAGVVIAGLPAKSTFTGLTFKAFHYQRVAASGTGAIVNAYGVYLDDVNIGTTNYAIYTNAGDVSLGDRLVLRTAASKIIPGATSLSLRNNADSADNLLVNNAGEVFVRSRLLIGWPGGSGDQLQVVSATVADPTVGGGVLTVGAGGASPQAAVVNLIPASTGIGQYQVGGTKVVGARVTGWAAATNTKLRTTFDTTTVTLPNLAARVGALLDDLITHGLIGT